MRLIYAELTSQRLGPFVYCYVIHSTMRWLRHACHFHCVRVKHKSKLKYLKQFYDMFVTAPAENILQKIYLQVLREYTWQFFCCVAPLLRAVTALIISLRCSVSKIYPFILYVRIYRIMCERYVDDIIWQWRRCISTCIAILLLQWWSTNTPTFAFICHSITSVKIVFTVFCYKTSLNCIFSRSYPIITIYSYKNKFPIT